MTTKGLEHIIFVLSELRSKHMQDKDPMIMERIQEAIVLCRKDIAKKKEQEGDRKKTTDETQ